MSDTVDDFQDAEDFSDGNKDQPGQSIDGEAAPEVPAEEFSAGEAALKDAAEVVEKP